MDFEALPLHFPIDYPMVWSAEVWDMDAEGVFSSFSVFFSIFLRILEKKVLKSFQKIWK